MRNILFTLLAVFLITACSNNNDEQKIAELETEKQKLTEESYRKDSVIVAIIETFDIIEGNLDSIRQKQGTITLDTKDDPELKETKRERIIRDMQMINRLMDENRSKIKSLGSKLRSAGIKIARLEKTLKDLQERIDNKDTEIQTLKDQLVNLDFSMDSLSVALEEQSKELEEKTELAEEKTQELNTAFYCFGSFKELKEQGVLTKEGGFIGIGKIEKLADDFNKKYFTEIDVTNVKSIALNVKKARVVTIHQPGSYKLEMKDGKTDKLVIMDAKEFWSASKYLVIVVE